VLRIRIHLATNDPGAAVNEQHGCSSHGIHAQAPAVRIEHHSFALSATCGLAAAVGQTRSVAPAIDLPESGAMKTRGSVREARADPATSRRACRAAVCPCLGVPHISDADQATGIEGTIIDDLNPDRPGSCRWNYGAPSRLRCHWKGSGPANLGKSEHDAVFLCSAPQQAPLRARLVEVCTLVDTCVR
jgi:hypothetical protein